MRRHPEAVANLAVELVASEHARDLELALADPSGRTQVRQFVAIGPARRDPVVAKPDMLERSARLEHLERALLHHGVIFFLLEKLAAVVGQSNLHVYAAMRGQSLREFQNTRNAPGAAYSVAGRERPSGRRG